MLFERIEQIYERPAPFSSYTADDLWTDPHTSERMLEFHIDGETDLASRGTEFINRSVDWFSRLTGLAPGSRLLDLGCGPGLYSNRLASTGAEVVGVDFSERSIAYAEATADPAARPSYVLGNYLDVEVPGTFDVVLLAMCDYGALSPDQRAELLQRIRGWLRQGGRFIFDVYSTRSLDERKEGVTYARDLMDGFWSAEPYHGFHHTFVYRDERVILDKYEIIESHRSRTVYNWLQCFTEADLRAELEASALTIDATFGDLAGAPLTPDTREICVVATSRDVDSSFSPH